MKKKTLYPTRETALYCIALIRYFRYEHYDKCIYCFYKFFLKSFIHLKPVQIQISFVSNNAQGLIILSNDQNPPPPYSKYKTAEKLIKTFSFKLRIIVPILILSSFVLLHACGSMCLYNLYNPKYQNKS